MVDTTCIQNVNHYWELSLPSTLTPHSLYFILTSPTTVVTYVTDANGVPYVIGGSGGGSGDITLTSPNGTISINGYAIDVQQSVLDGIITLHNNFPDLQGGTWHLTEDQHTRVLALIYANSLSTLAVNPPIGERGLATPITVFYNIQTNDDVFTSASINNGIGNVLSNVNAGLQSVSGGTKTLNATYTLSLGYTRNGVTTTETKNATYTTYIPQWKGISSSATLNSANYAALSVALQKTVQANTTLSLDVQPVGQYVWFVSTNPNASITNSGFGTTVGAWDSTTAFFIKQTVTLTLADGTTTASLTFYRTRNTVTLATVQNFTLI